MKCGKIHSKHLGIKMTVCVCVKERRRERGRELREGNVKHVVSKHSWRETQECSRDRKEASPSFTNVCA